MGFNATARIRELMTGPLRADSELAEELASIMVRWLKDEVEEANDRMSRQHQFSYAVSVWLPEAVAFGLQKLHPDKCADEIYDMVAERPAEYLEEEVEQALNEMGDPRSLPAALAEIDAIPSPESSTEEPEETDEPAPVELIMLGNEPAPVELIVLDNEPVPVELGAQGATGAVQEVERSTTRESCRPYAELAASREMDDDDEDDRPLFDRLSSKRTSARSPGENQPCQSPKRTRVDQSESTTTRKQKSARQIVFSFVTAFFQRQRERKREEIKSALEYLSQFDQRSLDVLQAYMNRHKSSGVNNDPVKAVKTMKKIETSEDAYDKAVDCYIARQGGIFGTATYRKSSHEQSSIHLTRHTSPPQQSSLHRRDSLKSLKEKKKKKKSYTAEDGSAFAEHLAQRQAARNRTDMQLKQHRQKQEQCERASDNRAVYVQSLFRALNQTVSSLRPSDSNAIANSERQFLDYKVGRSQDQRVEDRRVEDHRVEDRRVEDRLASLRNDNYNVDRRLEDRLADLRYNNHNENRQTTQRAACPTLY
uniref:Uncharacterized protein n=1 Tax=Plectus sambesii TaxID=2011161 RepID=A0A914XH66_9BILA